MDNKQLANKWFERASGENDPFNKFISLWISFNALYGKELDTYEKDRIRSFVRRNYSTKFDVILEGANFFYCPINNLHPLRPSSPRDTEKESKILANCDNSEKERIVNLMLCIYQARCNLFHGDKLPERYHDREILMHSADILEKYLSIYFS